jgi:hypothetical protein
MAAKALKFDHHFGEPLDRYFLSLAQMADGIILTEKTSEVAVGQKNGSGPLASYKRPFFSKMGRIGADLRLTTGFTESHLVSGPIDTTGPRADPTGFQHTVSLLDNAWKKPFPVGSEIGWLKIFDTHRLKL